MDTPQFRFVRIDAEWHALLDSITVHDYEVVVNGGVICSRRDLHSILPHLAQACDEAAYAEKRAAIDDFRAERDYDRKTR
jgi:hypothetical protein